MSLLVFVLVTEVKSGEHDDKDTTGIPNPKQLPSVGGSFGSGDDSRKHHSPVLPKNASPSSQQPDPHPRSSLVDFDTEELVDTDESDSGVELFNRKEGGADDSDSFSDFEFSDEEEEEREGEGEGKGDGKNSSALLTEIPTENTSLVDPISKQVVLSTGSVANRNKRPSEGLTKSTKLDKLPPTSTPIQTSTQSSNTGNGPTRVKKTLRRPSPTTVKPVTDKAEVSTQPKSKVYDEAHSKTIQLRRSTGKDRSVTLATIPEESPSVGDQAGEGDNQLGTETKGTMVDVNGNALDKTSDRRADSTTATNPSPQKRITKGSHSKGASSSGKGHSEPDYDTTVIHPDTTHSSDPGDARPLDTSSGGSTSGPIFSYPSHSSTTTKVRFAGPSSPTTTTDTSSQSPSTFSGDQGAHSATYSPSTVEPNNGLVAKYPSTDPLSEPTSDSKPTIPRDPIHTTPISPITIYNPLTSVDKRITRLSLYAVFGFCGVCFVGLVTSFIYTTCFGGATLLVVSNGVGSAGSVVSSSASSVAASADSVMELGKGVFQAAPTELATTATNTGSVEALTNISSVDVNQIDLI